MVSSEIKDYILCSCKASEYEDGYWQSYQFQHSVAVPLHFCPGCGDKLLSNGSIIEREDPDND